MKSFYSFTLVLGTLVMTYWPSLAQGARCLSINLLPLEGVRADMKNAVSSWKSASPAKELGYKGEVSSWICRIPKPDLTPQCSDYAQTLFELHIANNPLGKKVSGHCTGNNSDGVQVTWEFKGR